MKKVLLIAAMALVVLPSFAQITEGEPRATVLPTGNRLEKGIWGVFIGGAATWDKKDKDFNDNVFHVTPLVNVKYMFTDKIEGRLGFEFGKTKDRIGATQEVEEEVENEGEEPTTVTKDIKSSWKNVNSHIFFNPGIAYHFSKNNLLDVYAGAEIPFGWERQTTKYVYDGEDQGSTFSPKFNIGCGAFIGLQAFIGRLPLAIGLEYGFQSLFTTGNDKVKSISYDADGVKQVSYTSNNENFRGTFDSMSSRHGEIRSQVRLTLSYYFK